MLAKANLVENLKIVKVDRLLPNLARLSDFVHQTLEPFKQSFTVTPIVILESQQK